MNADGAGFSANRSTNSIDEVFVPGGREGQSLRKHGLLEGTDTVKTLSGMYEGDLQPLFVQV